MPRNWSAEAREDARQRCLKNKPWLLSTGTRTDAGKARSSQNSWRHGFYGKYFQAVSRYSSQCQRYEKAIATGKSVHLTPANLPNELKLAYFELQNASQSQF